MLKSKDIILRDFIKEDIDKRILWETVETEWQLWDGPWETENLTEQEKKDGLEKYIKKMQGWVERYKNMEDTQERSQFQIVTNDEKQTYIGWVSYYDMDDDYNYIAEDGLCAIGIDISDMSVRGKGYGSQALCLFIDYLFSHGKKDIYTQTWSGNERMVHVAEKLGFEECRRKKGIRKVRGNIYDGLTFKLNKDKYKTFRDSIL